MFYFAEMPRNLLLITGFEAQFRGVLQRNPDYGIRLLLSKKMSANFVFISTVSKESDH